LAITAGNISQLAILAEHVVSGKAAYTAKQTQIEWPFLLTTDGLLFHFEILMGFNIADRLATQFSIICTKLLDRFAKAGSGAWSTEHCAQE